LGEVPTPFHLLMLPKGFGSSFHPANEVVNGVKVVKVKK
jgi:hypothetical protein